MRRLLLLFAAAVVYPAGAQDAALTVDRIMQDPAKWIGDWPSSPFWHESGDTLYFWWNPNGLYEADSLFRLGTGDVEPVKVSPRERRHLGPIFDGWHHGENLYNDTFTNRVYERDGDIWLYHRPTGGKLRLTQTVEVESDPQLTPGESGVIYRQGNNLILHSRSGQVAQLTDLRSGTEDADEEPDPQDALLREQQLSLFETLRRRKEEREGTEVQEEQDKAAEDRPPTFYVGEKDIEQLQIDPAQRYVTFFLTERQDENKRTQVPEFVTESGYVDASAARAKVGYPPESQEFYVQNLRTDSTLLIDLHQIPGTILEDSTRRELYAYGPYWSPNARHAVMEVRAWDNKDRWIVRLDPDSATFDVLNHQHDDAWLQAPGIASQGGRSTMGWLPEGQLFYFQSEASGRSHLYTVDPESGETTQLTQGDFDVYDPMVSRSGEHWYFSSNEHSVFERHFYRMPIEGGERMRLTEMQGMNETAIGPREDRLAVLHSYTNDPPDIFLKELAQSGAPAVQVTESTTSAWNAYDWRDPDILTFEASDGVDVPAQVFVPDDPNGAAVLFVHGAGYLQNVHRGWSSYFREYMFHNLLADEGYVVMNLDYRGSSGYGRDWRTSVYRHMGGRDLQDYVDASRYVGSEYGIEPERVFIYGGSYGGFITLMALFTEPEHFGGGAALRSVTDWAHYHYGYTANILNTPMEDSLAFARSSPIYFAEGLEDPLLIAHGMVDSNVHFQDVVRLVQRLIELGKTGWELAVYPLEGHGFEEPESWADEYRRILKTIHLSVGPRDAALEEVPFLEHGTGAQ